VAEGQSHTNLRATHPEYFSYVKDFFVWIKDPSMIPKKRKSAEWCDAMSEMAIMWETILGARARNSRCGLFS